MVAIKWLLIGLVTVCGQVKHLGNNQPHDQLSLLVQIIKYHLAQTGVHLC